MKTAWTATALATIGILAISSPGRAQNSSPGFNLLMHLHQLQHAAAKHSDDQPDPVTIYLTKHPAERNELTKFSRQFAQAHPQIVGSLRKNPALALDPAWRSKQPEINAFIARHPGIWKAYLASTPLYWTKEFSQFAITYPSIGSAVRANPELLFDKKWVGRHAKLEEFLGTHDRIWEF